MANKARTPMTTAEEIIAWAEKTREANGEAFTMLNKDEQLLIAKFMLAMRDHIKTLQSNAPTPPPADAEPPSTGESECKGEDPETPEPDGPEGEPAPEPVPEEEILVRDINDKRQTNMEFFRANNISMQRAFELYERWEDVDPANRMIQDPKRKVWLKSAAFAFWLNMPHE